MTLGKFLKEEKGVVAVEYVVFAAAIGILLAAAVIALTGAMSNLFTAWAGYFGGS